LERSCAWRDPILDLRFEGENLPSILDAVEIEKKDGTKLLAECILHTGDGVARCVAMEATEGLSRGLVAKGTGARFGARRQGSPRPYVRPRGQDHRRRPPGRRPSARPSTATPRALEDQSPNAEILETGIKVIDLIAPYAKGGKIGLFGGAGVGKTVIIRSSSATSRPSTPATPCSPASASEAARATTSGRT
jgi:F0F1-type ATP synthase beta subunit